LAGKAYAMYAMAGAIRAELREDVENDQTVPRIDK